MKKELLTHRWAYVILFIGLALFIYSFLTVWPNRELQRVIVLVFSGFYFFWGIVTHIQMNAIKLSIILEYLSMAVFAALLLLLVTL